jgi:hypothetical protein
MKKIKKFLSVLLSSLMLSGGKFTRNKASAINENKIVYTNDNRKFIYISTENIPAVLKLLRNKIEKESKMRFSKSGNIIYKTLVAGAGAVLGVSSYLGASKIENKTASKVTAASLCAAIGAGTLAALFVPEYINSKIPYIEGYAVTNASDLTGPKDLLTELERVIPDTEYRKKHNKVVKDESLRYSDLGQGIIIAIVPGSDNKPKFIMARQGSNLTVDEKKIDIENNAYLRIAIKDYLRRNYSEKAILAWVEKYIYDNELPKSSGDKILNLIQEIKNSPNKETIEKKYEEDSKKFYDVVGREQTLEGYYILEGGVDHKLYHGDSGSNNINFNASVFDNKDSVSKTHKINSWDETLINEFFSNK